MSDESLNSLVIVLAIIVAVVVFVELKMKDGRVWMLDVLVMTSAVIAILTISRILG
jgi:hypothetical protein